MKKIQKRLRGGENMRNKGFFCSFIVALIIWSLLIPSAYAKEVGISYPRTITQTQDYKIKEIVPNRVFTVEGLKATGAD